LKGETRGIGERSINKRMYAAGCGGKGGMKKKRKGNGSVY